MSEEKKDDDFPVVVGGGEPLPSAPSVEPNPIDTTAATADGAPRAPPLSQPSYYQASFHEHFYPHEYDPAVDGDGAGLHPKKKGLSLFQRYAASNARRPWVHLLSALVASIALSFVGLKFGNFKVQVDNVGWWSRNTEVADRATQEWLVKLNRREMFFDETGEVWDELQSEVQGSWQRKETEGEESNNEAVDETETVEKVCSGEWYGGLEMTSPKERNLISVWKASGGDEEETDLLSAQALFDLCAAEENTLRALEERGACHECGDGKCVHPYSLAFLAKLYLLDHDKSKLFSLPEEVTCEGLRDAWSPSVRKHFVIALQICAGFAVRLARGEVKGPIVLPGTNATVFDPCPFPVPFSPAVVDELFLPSEGGKRVRYSSSIYATKRANDVVEAMYDANQDDDAYDRGGRGGGAEAVYDTIDEDFSDLYADAIVGRDMTLAVGSAGVTVFAMLLHTRSPFLTFMGLLQILLSFPLSYFVYHFLGGIVFFPFLNFIGIFVVFALGADDVFVAVDKWKNARNELPHATTEQVAALALPDAAYAMLLTSVTTSVAFFSTAISPVGPIVCFAVFCGLLVVIDYMMNILLVFPALCLYDRWTMAGTRNCCVSFDGCSRMNGEGGGAGADDAKDDDGKKGASGASEASASVSKPGDEGDVDANSVERQVPADFASQGGDELMGESVKTFAGEGERYPCSHQAATGPIVGEDDGEEEREALLVAEHETLVHRILDGYYRVLHRFRWIVLVAVIAAFAVCTAFAARLSLPLTSEVALLPDSNEYQKHWTWKQNLLATTLAKEVGSSALIVWGLTPADTGDKLNPDSWTTLVLDESFDPRSKEAQSYLLSFCDRLFADFGKVKDDYECPIHLFDKWLGEQAASATPTEAYVNHCAGAKAIPLPSETFDPCIISWSKLYNVTSVLQTDGRIKVMEVRTKSNVVYDSPFKDLKDEWTAYEAWLDDERDSAPSGADRMYHSDIAFWWFDTNSQMIKTAYGSAGIALVCASVVVFVSSRSFMLTLFAVFSIGYVLVAATACLVGLGWELGFLESVLFAILIGISCDFVLHVAHAYTMYSGSVNRHYRSQFSLNHMGPSILAAAFTTFMAAVVMMFTEITFFTKFAVMLFMTIVHSIIGCFVVFLVLCDCFGPSEPQKGYEMIKAKLCKK